MEHIANTLWFLFIKLFPAMLLVGIDGSGDNLVIILTIDQTSIRLEIPHYTTGILRGTTGILRGTTGNHKAPTAHKQHDLQKLRFH